MLLVVAVLTGFVKELNINYPVHFFLTLSMINLEIVHLDVALLKLLCNLADPGCLSSILILIHPGSRIQQQTQKRRGEYLLSFENAC
jgi:hypothetical protein